MSFKKLVSGKNSTSGEYGLFTSGKNRHGRVSALPSIRQVDSLDYIGDEVAESKLAFSRAIETNFCMLFVDGQQQKRFIDFSRARFNSTLLMALLAITTLLLTPAVGLGIRYESANRNVTKAAEALNIIAVALTYVLFIAPGALVLYLRRTKRMVEEGAFSKRRLPKIFHWLSFYDQSIENMFIVGAIMSQGLLLLTRVLNGQCSDTSDKPTFMQVLYCNPEARVHALPQDSAFAVVLLPYFLFQTLKGADWKVTIAAWVLSFIWMAASIAAAGAWNRSGVLLLFSAMDGVRMIRYHRQNISMYLSVLEQRRAIAEKLDAEHKNTQSDEIRNLIANMAHDLKSPMQAFSNSIADLEGTLIQAVQSPKVADDVQDMLMACLKVINDMTTTSQFMTMTINRALDYSKASHGIKLIPTFRSVDIMETIGWPIRCMKNLQDRITIRLDELPDDVFPFCITDGQWLQENILCVLSNAVKFSFGGTVVLSVSLVQEVKRPPTKSGVSSPSSIVSFGQDKENDPPMPVLQNMLRFQVVDTGIGISPEAQEAAFQPLKRSATDRHSGGAGLGLYSLSKRVEALGGSCGIGPRTDGVEGTMVWFTEPYRPDFTPMTNTGEPIDVSQESIRNIRNRRVTMTPGYSMNLLTAKDDFMSSYRSPRSRLIGSSASAFNSKGNSRRLKPFSVDNLATLVASGRDHIIRSGASSKRSSLYFRQPSNPRQAGSSEELEAQEEPGLGLGSVTQPQIERALLGEPKDDASPRNDLRVFTRVSTRTAWAQPASAGVSRRNSFRASSDQRGEGERKGRGGSIPPLKILIVDDSTLTVKSIAALLREAGHHVDARDGRQAAAVGVGTWQAEYSYDVMLIDLLLPATTGIDVMRSCRDSERSERYSPITDKDAMLLTSLDVASAAKVNDANVGSTTVDKVNAIETVSSIRRPIETDTVTSIVGAEKSSPSASTCPAPALAPTAAAATARKKTLIIGMSSTTDTETIAKATEAGMDKFLLKPFTIGGFEQVVRSVPELVPSRSASSLSVPSSGLPLPGSAATVSQRQTKVIVSESEARRIGAVQWDDPSASRPRDPSRDSKENRVQSRQPEAAPKASSASILAVKPVSASVLTSQLKPQSQLQQQQHQQKSLDRTESANDSAQPALSPTGCDPSGNTPATETLDTLAELKSIPHMELGGKFARDDLSSEGSVQRASSNATPDSSARIARKLSRRDSSFRRNVVIPPLKVLVVDDSLTIAKTMVRSLQRQKHITETASNGAIALQYMKQNKYDVVLMDIQMPVMDGIEAVIEFRKHEEASRGPAGAALSLSLSRAALPTVVDDSSQHEKVAGAGSGGNKDGNIDIPSGPLSGKNLFIIGVSANSDPVTRKKALDAGMNKFMPKPFTIEMFEDIIVGEMNLKAQASTGSLHSSASNLLPS